MERKHQKEFLILKIMAFESATSNIQNLDQDTCHWLSMIYETRLSFNISIREVFPKSRSLTVIRKYDEGALIQILQQSGTL